MSKRSALAAATAVCLVPFAAQAQDPAQDSRPGRATSFDDEIIVTAQRREQTLAEVPISVSVIGAAELERQEIRNIDDLVQALPSVNVTKTTNSSAFNLSIRGQGPAAQERGVEQSVGIYVDGIYRSRPVAGIADFVDISRVEVLKGPQSSIFGRNNSAGALSIVTLEPSREFGGSYVIGYDNFDTLTAQGTITGALLDNAQDALAARLSVSYRDRNEGTIDNVGNGPEIGTFDRLSVRGQILASIGPATEVRFIADYSDLQDECCGFVPYFVPDADVPIFGALGITIPGLASGRRGQANGVDGVFLDLDRRELITDTGYDEGIEDWGLSIQLDHDFGDHLLTLTGSTRQSESNVNFELDGSNVSIFPILPYRSVPNSEFEETQFEVRIASELNSPFNYLVGAYYFDQEITDNNTLRQSTIDLISVNTVTNGEAFAVFGQGSYDFTDRLTATVGLRYNDETKTFDYSDIDPFGSLGLGPNAAATSEVKDDALMGDVSLNYALDARNSLYARYARGYKSPGANLLTFGTPSADLLKFDAETVDAYEVGVKFGGERFRGSAAAFYQDTQDLQVQSIDLNAPVPLLKVDNAAEVTAYGFEVDALWEPVDGLVLSGAATILEAEFDEYLNASALAIGGTGLQDLSGATPLQSPSFAASGSAQYTFSVGGGYVLTPRIDLTHKGAHFVTSASDPFYRNDAYTLVGLNLALTPEDERWSLAVYGRNVTDETYILTGTSFRTGFGGPALSAQQAAINDPATYGITLRGSF
ncbi:MAG: TonB-dependent receptor [Pseudomonadota bacterium]